VYVTGGLHGAVNQYLEPVDVVGGQAAERNGSGVVIGCDRRYLSGRYQTRETIVVSILHRHTRRPVGPDADVAPGGSHGTDDRCLRHACAERNMREKKGQKYNFVHEDLLG
jgi:hypothetical protein